MGSLIEELTRHEAAARAEADRLPARIEELQQDLARAEERASRLVIAREEVTRVLGEPAAAEPPDGRPAGRESRGRAVLPACPAGRSGPAAGAAAPPAPVGPRTAPARRPSSRPRRGPASSAASAVNMACETANGSSEYAAIEGSSFLRSGFG